MRPALLERMPPMETARPQANGIIGMVNGDTEQQPPPVTEEKPSYSEPVNSAPPSDSVGSSCWTP